MSGTVFDKDKFHHVGVIVRDMDKAIAHLTALGIGPFRMPGGKPWIEIPFKGELRGRPVEFKLRVSNARVGGIELELLQPSGGESAMQEFLDRNGEGLHHIGYTTDNLDGAIKALGKKGIKVLTGARVGDGGFAYFETGAVGGVITELRQIESK
ncbi:MAG: hypothetical protein A2Z05_05740 [Chloroflexi bacterium RBG_16_60_22]|nr:MAG: hypothetical protein A2Z05_05740 [Chloroflexi bacterium RBG_16_60_22]